MRCISIFHKSEDVFVPLNRKENLATRQILSSIRNIHVEVPRVDYEKLADKRQVENSTTIRKRVQAARERQLQRFGEKALTCNAEMGPSEVRDYCEVEASAEKLLKAAMQQLHLSARAYHRVLKLARTIADLAESEKIAANHVAEAVQYRPRMGL